MVGVKVQTSVRGRDRESTLRLQRVLAEPTRAGGGNGGGPGSRRPKGENFDRGSAQGEPVRPVSVHKP
jgi:hypothetical protein